MRRVTSTELKIAEIFLKAAQKEAKKATCLERKCGAVLVRNNIVIGRGFNSPPKNLESQRRCNNSKDSLDKKITDKTCCCHAEKRSISKALKRDSVTGSTLYFTSVDADGNRLPSGKPYCTDCSKIALDEGVYEWILEHDEGVIAYTAEEYNDLSFDYRG